MDVVEFRTKPTGPERSDAIAELFVAHHRRLVGLAFLLVDDRETAEDVVQEAFAGLYFRWRQLRDPNAAVAYLNRAVMNGSRNQLRHRKRVGFRLARMTLQSEELASAEQTAVQHDEADRLWQAVLSLPLRQRQVLVLRYYLNLTEAEIASTLRVSRGSVKTHASRGLATLAQHMEAGS
jgi:RNA polymerase sigma-70 factor (sigma-E family)